MSIWHYIFQNNWVLSSSIRGAYNWIVLFPTLLGQLDTLVPSTLKAIKFSGPPAFWSPQTCFGPPHICAVCGNFKDRGYFYMGWYTTSWKRIWSPHHVEIVDSLDKEHSRSARWSQDTQTIKWKLGAEGIPLSMKTQTDILVGITSLPFGWKKSGSRRVGRTGILNELEFLFQRLIHDWRIYWYLWHFCIHTLKQIGQAKQVARIVVGSKSR